MDDQVRPEIVPDTSPAELEKVSTAPPALGSTRPARVRRKKSKTAFALRELLAVLFWLYAVLKLFISDIDAWIVDKYIPNASWIVTYKFFILLGQQVAPR